MADSESGRIMLVEDDPATQALVSALLDRRGHRTTAYADGRSALEALEREGPPDILLLDWMLPGMTGLEVCYKARQRWDLLSLPILMLTAKGDAESKYAAFDAGASDYITKPFVGTELRARVEVHLRTRRLYEQQRAIEEQLAAREKLSAIGLVASGMAHDLANPLSGIAGYAQLLLQEETRDEARRDLQHILDAVARCSEIVERGLSLVRSNANRHGTVDLPALVADALAVCQRSLAAVRVEPRVEVESTARVVGDDHALRQVFFNIVLNATHALRDGGSELRVEIRDGVLESAEGASVIEVQFFNDAPPIPPDVLPHIFDPFFTTKGEAEGTGLGLAMARRVIEQHGGSIGVESDAGGTRFRILLPASCA